MRPYHLENMEVEDLDALLVKRPDLHKEIAAAREIAECPHDEWDHDICLHCGYERDPGIAIDAAKDRWEDLHYD